MLSGVHRNSRAFASKTAPAGKLSVDIVAPGSSVETGKRSSVPYFTERRPGTRMDAERSAATVTVSLTSSDPRSAATTTSAPELTASTWNSSID